MHVLAAMFPGYLTLVVSPLLALAREQCESVHETMGEWAEVVGDSRRKTAYVLGGSNQFDFDETIGRQCPVEELDARREATLRGDCSGDLCCELTDSLLLELSEKLQMPPAPGHKPRPLVSPEKLMNSLQVLAFLRDVARLEVRAVSLDGGTCFESAFKFVFVDEAHCVADHGS